MLSALVASGALAVLQIKVELSNELGVVLEVEVLEVVLGDEVVVDLVEQVGQHLLVGGAEGLEILQRNFTTVFVLTILALIFQPEKVRKKCVYGANVMILIIFYENMPRFYSNCVLLHI
jgi:hypothetical protein